MTTRGEILPIFTSEGNLSKTKEKSSHHGSAVTTLTTIGIHEGEGSIPGLAQWVKDLALP